MNIRRLAPAIFTLMFVLLVEGFVFAQSQIFGPMMKAPSGSDGALTPEQREMMKKQAQMYEQYQQGSGLPASSFTTPTAEPPTSSANFRPAAPSVGSRSGNTQVFDDRLQKFLEAPKNAPAAKSSSKPADLSKFTQVFKLGPDFDREIFYLTTQGDGELTATLNWTGTATSLKMEIGPKVILDKDSNNQVGRGSGRIKVALNFDIGDTEDLSTEEIIDEGAEIPDDDDSLLYFREKTGVSPLTDTVLVDQDVNQEIQITISNWQGQANGTIQFSGTVKLKKVVRKEFKPESLSASGKIIVPLVMHQLDRHFRNLPANQKTALDQKFSNHLLQGPLALGKLQNALSRYQTMPATTKKQLFNSKVVQTIDSLQGGALTPAKNKEIGTLLKVTLVPSRPKNLEATAELTDPDAAVGGKELTLKWKHDALNTDSYVIERAVKFEANQDTGELVFEEYKTKKAPKKRGTSDWRFHKEIQSYELYPDLYCYRIKAVNKIGVSGYSEIACPDSPSASLVQSRYNLKWTTLHSEMESEVDGLSNSDEPYLIFTMVNGLNTDGTPNVWTRRWTGADDVDSDETEPDAGPAAFTLFGAPPAGAMAQLQALKDQLANTPRYQSGTGGFWTANPEYVALEDQINNHPWGPKMVNNLDQPDLIDLGSGLVVNVTVMEHDDGATVTLEEQIKAGVYAAMDVAEAFASPDPYHVAEAVKSTLEFLYSLWANDDFVDTATFPLTYMEAFNLVPSVSGTGGANKTLRLDGGSTGIYDVGLCLYPEEAAPAALQNSCGIVPQTAGP